MIRYFRTRAPLFGLLLLLALLITLPGVRHPLPLLGLAIFGLLAWRALSRWTKSPDAARTLDDDVSRAASQWDDRHGPPDASDASDEPVEEPWRASLRPSDDWRGTNADDAD